MITDERVDNRLNQRVQFTCPPWMSLYLIGEYLSISPPEEDYHGQTDSH